MKTVYWKINLTPKNLVVVLKISTLHFYSSSNKKINFYVDLKWKLMIMIFNAMVIARCSQGFCFVVGDLCFGFSGQLGEIVGLSLGDVVLAHLQGLLGLVPSLLDDLLGGLLALSWISADAGVGLLVKALNLQLDKVMN